MAAAHCIALLLITVAVSDAMTTTGCHRRKFLTFNVGLTPRIASYDVRRHDVAAALRATDADVVCLQEVWLESDMQAILETTSHVYRHSFSFIHHDTDQLQKPKSIWDHMTLNVGQRVGGKACSLVEGARLAWCLTTQCRGRGTGQDLLLCMRQNCPAVLPGLSQDCRTCVFVAASSLATAVQRCGNMGSYNRFNPTGLLLLSRRPLTTAVPRYFLPTDAPQFLPRGFIDAQVNGVGRVLCAHLSAKLEPYMEFALNYSSYEEQQLAEVNLLDALYRRVRHVLLGDLNMGPRDPARGLTGEFPANYERLQAIGYRSPYDEQGGQCTHCGGSNPLLPNSTSSNILDHVTSKTFSQTSSARTLETHQGRTLSDHYGVQVEGCF